MIDLEAVLAAYAAEAAEATAVAVAESAYATFEAPRKAADAADAAAIKVADEAYTNDASASAKKSTS